nr:MAG TPA: hypothetical protein [Bacteriophage sp.]
MRIAGVCSLGFFIFYFLFLFYKCKDAKQQ